MVQYYSPCQSRHRPPSTPLWGEPHCRFCRYHSIGPSSSGTSFHITPSGVVTPPTCLVTDLGSNPDPLGLTSVTEVISHRNVTESKSSQARLCYPNFFFSYKNIKNARHINASVQVSKIRYLSQGLARRINTINTTITVLLCSAFR